MPEKLKRLPWNWKGGKEGKDHIEENKEVKEAVFWILKKKISKRKCLASFSEGQYNDF